MRGTSPAGLLCAALLAGVLAAPASSAATSAPGAPDQPPGAGAAAPHDPDHAHDQGAAHDHGAATGRPAAPPVPPLPPGAGHAPGLQDDQRGHRTMRGTFQRIATDVPVAGATEHSHADGSTHLHTRDVYRDVLEVDGSWVELRLPAADKARLKGGEQVEVQGYGTARDLDANRTTTLAAASVASSGTTSVLVILAHWGSPDKVTPTMANDVVFTKGNVYFKEASYGALSITGKVHGSWVKITAPTGGDCYGRSDELMTRAKAAAKAGGSDAASYARTIVYFPSCSASSAAGWATVGGSSVWLNGYMDHGVSIHEQGHNYGLSHAHSIHCKAGTTPVTLVGTTTTATTGACNDVEYGDAFDAMGSSFHTGHFAGPYKDKLGWLGSRKVFFSSESPTLTLTPMETSSGTKTGIVRVSATRAYWVELRTATGQDSTFRTGAIGVQVRLVDAGMGGTDSYLLDLQPTSTESSWGSDEVVVLPAGSSWTTPEGARITVGSVTATTATVTAQGSAGAPKAPDAPTALTGKAGDQSATLSWSRPADDNGSMITEYVVKAIPSSGTATTTTVPAPGGSPSTTAVTGLTNGVDYTFTVAARNAVGLGVASAASGTVRPTAATPTVTLTSPSAGTVTSGGAVVLSATASPSGITSSPITGVDFRVGWESLPRDTTAPYEVTWTPDSWMQDGDYDITATATDASGRTSTSPPVKITLKVPAPTATIVSPVTGATAVDSLPVSVQADAPPGRTVDYVRLRVDNSLSGSYLDLDPATGRWTGTLDVRYVEEGAHTVVASVTDDLGRTGQSEPVSFTVSHPAPTVSITSPAPEAVVIGSTSVTVDVAPNPAGGGAVTRVELVADGTSFVGSSWEAPFTMPLDGRYLSDGRHTLVAKAYNESGFVGLSAPIAFELRNPRPSVTITSPSSGATVSGTQTITGVATPSPDSGSPISYLTFALDDRQISAYAYPEADGSFTVEWDSRRELTGAHELVATAYDSGSYSGTSAPVVVVLDNPGPSVAITSPAAGAQLTGDIPVTLEVSPSPAPISDGTISYVSVSVDGVESAWGYEAPWSVKVYSWGMQPGEHVLVATVHDYDGVRRASAPVTITALRPPEPPGAPATVSAVGGPSSVTVSWTPPTDDGGQPITGYAVYSEEDARQVPASARSTTFTGLQPGVEQWFYVAAVNASGESYDGSWVMATPTDGTGPGPDPEPAAASTYTPVDPLRVLDTRPAPDNVGAPVGKVGAGGYVDLQVTGGPRAIPSDATAVVLNVTVTGATASTDVRAYPTPAGTQPLPQASNLNVYKGQTVANLVVVKVGNGGKVRIRNASGSVNLLADVAGYYRAGTEGASYVGVDPVRLMDTRPAYQKGPRTGALNGGEVVDLKVGGTNGVPDSATAVVLNVTAVSPTAGTDVRVYPTAGSEVPLVSNINVPRGVTAPNLVVVKLGTDGKVRLRNASGAVHLLADLAGWYAPGAAGGSAFTPVSPVRVLDSRPAPDNVGVPAGRIGAGQTVDLTVAGTAAVPAGAKAVVLNVTAVGALGGTDVRVYPTPTDGGFPDVSNLNVRAGITVPNLVVVKVGDLGKVRFRSSSAGTNLIADLAGYYS
jgi:hypothetical protein